MTDGWDFSDPVDILPKLPENFQELVASKKWQERKEALEGLLTLATKNPRLDPKANYLEVIDTLSKILAKDANINICAVAAKCLAQFAKGLRAKFRIYASSVIQVIFDKFKEKKVVLKDVLVETIDAVYASTNLDSTVDEVAAALEKQNPDIKKQTNLFLYRVFKTFDAQTAPKKAIKALTPLVVKCTTDPDAETREAAFLVLGAMMNVVGKENAMPMLSKISSDKTKMAQVEKFYTQVQSEIAESKNLEVEIGGESQRDTVSSEELIKLKNINSKLTAEKTEMKSELDKALTEKTQMKTQLNKAFAENKKLSQDLSKALQKSTESKASNEEVMKWKAQNIKLNAEKADMKTKLDKALVENKKISQELSKALQRISEIEKAPRKAILGRRSVSIQQAVASGSRIPSLSPRIPTLR